MIQSWQTLTFLHWRYPADVIQRHVPGDLRVETFDGSAWVGLVPFHLQGLRPPAMPALPWLSFFPETNVRTYVRNNKGEPGVWFFTLEAARLTAVVGARILFGLPYHWARMAVEFDGDAVIYSSRRYPPGEAYSQIRIIEGAPMTPGDLDIFLTARFRLYSLLRGKVVWVDVQHPPWPLSQARVEALDQTLIEACGLPAAHGHPLVHYSPGVTVQVGPISSE